jgi:hypothetical protein
MTQPVDRERAALEAILDALLPQLSYYVHWTYRVTGTSDGPPVTISAKSQDPRVPDLARIVLRQGPDGGYATPANGSLISVGFLNADPSLPYVHSLDPTATVVSSWQHGSTLVELGSGSAAALAHSGQTSAIFQAIAIQAAAQATFAAATKVIVDSLLPISGVTALQIGTWDTAEGAFVTATTTTLTGAITAQLPGLPTTIVKGT